MRFIFLLFLTIGFLSANSKVALVIGNSNYSTKPLPNAKQDAKDIRDKLKALGYDVVFVPNADVTKFSQAITDFHKKVIGAEIAVVFYAGHGIEIGGENYMIPLGVNAIYTRRDLANLIKLSDIITEAEIAKSFGVLFVDACRDNPLKNKIDPTIRSSVTRGLGQVDTPSNILVSFATKAKQVVNDGDGKNSPYTTALKEFITNQEDIRFVIGKVKDQVVKETRNSPVRQEPTMFGTLGGSRYCLSGSCAKIDNNSQELARLKAENERLINQQNRYVPPKVEPKPKPVQVVSTSKWIKPTNSVCKANGGKIDKHGVCEATWENAKKICLVSGGQLPSKDDFYKVIADCGGILNVRNIKSTNGYKNRHNNSYQFCYKEKGFSSFSNYWSSTINSDFSSAWTVYFDNGDVGWGDKTYESYVKCVH